MSQHAINFKSLTSLKLIYSKKEQVSHLLGWLIYYFLFMILLIEISNCVTIPT